MTLTTKHIKSDLLSGLVVFLVALPLCLGIALGSGASPFSGIISGIIGGIVIGYLSKSHVSVSGPAAGLIAIVVTAIGTLKSFDVFLLAVIIAGCIQLILGFLKSGSLANFIPNNVIEGMLAGIGISIFLKQLPHAIGYDKDFEGDDTFWQLDGENSFTEIIKAFDFISFGAIVICLISICILLFWTKLKIQDKIKFLPGALVAVITSIILTLVFQGTSLEIKQEHLVSLPIFNNLNDFWGAFVTPDFSAITNYQVWIVGFTIAIVASVESLLSLEAADRLDPQKRFSNPNTELKAQGFGNILSGLIGGLPMTSVVIRTSANINSGGKTKLSTIIHGVFLLISVITIPYLLNKIPLATLAAILILIGYKLASPTLFKKFYQLGWDQFLPFLITVIGVVTIDLLKGVLLGLFVSVIFILKGNIKKAHSFKSSKLQNDEKINIKLAQEVSFLNKAKIKETLQNLPQNSTVIIDAAETVYIDNDVIELIVEFCKFGAKEKNITIQLFGFEEQYALIHQKALKNLIENKIISMKTLNKEIQESITPRDALAILKTGNNRFMNNLNAHRDLLEQVNKTSDGQWPFATILSCIDSRTSAELIFDQGLGDVFSIRIAGNIVNTDILGSMEFACKVAGSKLIVVLGHSKCGAIKGACNHVEMGNLTELLSKIQPAVYQEKTITENRNADNSDFVENVAAINVKRSVVNIIERSFVLEQMLENGEIGIVGAMHNIVTGEVEFYDDLVFIKDDLNPNLSVQDLRQL